MTRTARTSQSAVARIWPQGVRCALVQSASHSDTNLCQPDLPHMHAVASSCRASWLQTQPLDGPACMAS